MVRTSDNAGVAEAGGQTRVDGEDEPRTGVPGLAWRIDRYLRGHIGSYRWILAIGLMIGLSQSATTLAHAFNVRTFTSLRAAAVAIVAAVFEAALLVNQLAQVSDMSRERKARRAMRGQSRQSQSNPGDPHAKSG